jgi:putative ABC transport system ATP-binding protein
VTTLAARDVEFAIGVQPILAAMSLTVGAGESLAVTGPSGAGKTSLLALLAGLAEPTAGLVLVDGIPRPPGIPAGFVVVLQGYGLVSLLTARENVEAALRASGRTPGAARPLASAALDKVELGDFADHLVDDLSGGQQQRVAVARALALTPDVLIADEPTAELDATTRALVMRLLLGVTARGGVLVLATHDDAVAAQCSVSVRLHPPAR